MKYDKLAYDTVYIVDDNKTINLLHFQVIKNTGIARDIKVYNNPLDALDDLKKEVISTSNAIMVLLDINMEEINGFDFLDSLLSVCFTGFLNIVMVTSSNDPQFRQKSLEHPLVSGYINKPLTKEQIFDIVQIVK
ncbi:response regulator [Arenibacter sp. N53]|uniref:response regulator n=1 Tax=Arenibacter TaxID=178469 RepID=UPI000CD3D037|nr:MULTISPECIES: response regulator [Arenibacter]MCM4153561.1 response regulator [Arenibacter sp. N53]